MESLYDRFDILEALRSFILFLDSFKEALEWLDVNCW